MTTRLGKAGRMTFLGSLVIAGPTVAACDTGPTYDQWAGTDGAAGRINMEDVQKAFKDSKSVTDFQEKVNRIYEGDGLVLIRAKQEQIGLTLEGWEDLSKPANYEIDDTQDDLLFSIVEKDEGHEMRGHGANGYYNRGFGGGDFLFTYLILSSMTPYRGGYYGTPPSYARTTVANDRTRYRNSSRYRGQVGRNSRYFKSAPAKYGASRYAAAGRSRSTARQGYMSRQQSTGAFKSSGTGVRSSWRSSGRGGVRGGGRGGFRGGGGGTTIIGSHRG